MNSIVESFLRETHCPELCKTAKWRLFEDLKDALADMSESFQTCNNLDSFVKKMFIETKLDREFWLESKSHFFGNNDLVEFINEKSKKLDLLQLDFLKQYRSIEACNLSRPSNRMFENEYMKLGIFGENKLLQYLNEYEDATFYTPSGRLLLHSVPCIGATPDYLMLDRKDCAARFMSPYEYVKRARGVAEVKTTMTPENFYPKKAFSFEDLECLLQKAIKQRHFLLYTQIPNVNCTKTNAYPKVNWLTPSLISGLLECYFNSCKIEVIDVVSDETYLFDFKALEKKLFVNFVTSVRGKQVLGQCLVFWSNNKSFDENIELTLFYLYMKREDPEIIEYLVKLTCNIPVTVLEHIEVELQKKVYSNYISKCINV